MFSDIRNTDKEMIPSVISLSVSIDMRSSSSRSPGGAGIFTNVWNCDLGDRIVYRMGLRGTFKSRDGIGETW